MSDNKTKHAVNLQIVYVYDEETGGRGFRIPSLGIVGGAETREEAEEQARAAVLFTREGSDTDLLPGEDVGRLHVEVKWKADR